MAKRRWSRRSCVVAGVAACLVLGVLTSVAVAWAIALARTPTFTFVHRLRLNVAGPGEPSWTESVDFVDEYRPGFSHNTMLNNGNVVRVDRRLAEQAQMMAGSLKFLEQFESRPGEASSYLYPPREPSWPAWMMMPEGDEQYVRLSGRAAGRPWLCLSQRSGEKADGTVVSVGGLRVFPASRYAAVSTKDLHHGEIPLLPVWSGLVKNTLVFAAAWGVLVVLPMAWAVKVWRENRRRRGLCEYCGYDIQGAGVCPECGGGEKRPQAAGIRQ